MLSKYWTSFEHLSQSVLLRCFVLIVVSLSLTEPYIVKGWAESTTRIMAEHFLHLDKLAIMSVTDVGETTPVPK